MRTLFLHVRIWHLTGIALRSINVRFEEQSRCSDQLNPPPKADILLFLQR
jgi:hypothetical protein